MGILDANIAGYSVKDGLIDVGLGVATIALTATGVGAVAAGALWAGRFGLYGVRAARAASLARKAEVSGGAFVSAEAGAGSAAQYLAATESARKAAAVAQASKPAGLLESLAGGAKTAFNGIAGVIKNNPWKTAIFGAPVAVATGSVAGSVAQEVGEKIKTTVQFTQQATPAPAATTQPASTTAPASSSPATAPSAAPAGERAGERTRTEDTGITGASSWVSIFSHIIKNNRDNALAAGLAGLFFLTGNGPIGKIAGAVLGWAFGVAISYLTGWKPSFNDAGGALSSALDWTQRTADRVAREVTQPAPVVAQAPPAPAP